MLKNILVGLGWLLIVSAGFNIGIKLFGSDEIVLMLAGSDRNLDAPSLGIAIGLGFLALGSILKKLDAVLQRNEPRHD